MTKNSGDRTEYVEQVRENTRRYVEEMLEKNENLRQRVSSLEEERSELERRLIVAQLDLDRRNAEEVRLRQSFDDIKSEQQRFLEEFSKVEEQNNNLASLYAATYELHGSLDRKRVLQVIEEIVANLIGSEEIALLEISPGGDELTLLASRGIEPADFQGIPIGSGLIGRAVSSGAAYLAQEHPSDGALPFEGALTACVPLRIDGRVTGAIAVFHLLQQKPGLESLDFELFDLLANQAATALYCTRLHEQFDAARAATHG